MKCREIILTLEELSPKQYACDWDNVGLVVGRKDKEIHKIMVALDASKEVVAYAVKEQVDLLITHHPMIFSKIKQVNDDHFTSEKILDLVENGIAHYAMHTNFDAVGGMADYAVGKQYLNLTETAPLEPYDQDGIGIGRYGKLPRPMTCEQICEFIKDRFHLPYVMVYQNPIDKNRIYERIAVLPGSGKHYLSVVKEAGYDLYLTGDFTHHEGLDAIDMGICVIDATHYGLEHIFISYVADYLRKRLDWNADKIIEADMGNPMQIL